MTEAIYFLLVIILGEPKAYPAQDEKTCMEMADAYFSDSEYELECVPKGELYARYDKTVLDRDEVSL